MPRAWREVLSLGLWSHLPALWDPGVGRPVPRDLGAETLVASWVPQWDPSIRDLPMMRFLKSEMPVPVVARSGVLWSGCALGDAGTQFGCRCSRSAGSEEQCAL